RAVADDAYCREKRELLERNELDCWALGAHLVGQAVCDPIDERHRATLPPDVWGDGDPAEVRRRAADRMKDTARAAARFGVTQVNGFSGSPIWHRLYHVHVKDSKKRLDGRRSILGSHLNFGEEERGWDFVSPGHGDVEFGELFRTLNRIGYRGPLSIEWEDSGMDRDYGAQDALAF